jgi:hypothetical protein
MGVRSGDCNGHETGPWHHIQHCGYMHFGNFSHLWGRVVVLHQAVSIYLAVNEVEYPPIMLVTLVVKIINTDCHSYVLLACVGQSNVDGELLLMLPSPYIMEVLCYPHVHVVHVKYRCEWETCFIVNSACDKIESSVHLFKSWWQNLLLVQHCLDVRLAHFVVRMQLILPQSLPHRHWGSANSSRCYWDNFSQC